MTTPHVASLTGLVRRTGTEVARLVRQLAADIVAYVRPLIDRGEAGGEIVAVRTAAVVAIVGAGVLLMLPGELRNEEAVGVLLAVAVQLWARQGKRPTESTDPTTARN